MARASRYKWEKGDQRGLYKVIKVLPKKANVKNLVIWCECLLCGEKVERWSNRLDSQHRGCPVKAKVAEPEELQPETIVAPLPHMRANGQVVKTNKNGNVVETVTTPEDIEELAAGSFGLQDDIVAALNFDVDEMARAYIKESENLDGGVKFTFLSTLRRYLSLVHIARKIERKLALNEEITVDGSSGNKVVNPLLKEYKAISAESNATAKLLNAITTKGAGDDDDEDELTALLSGKAG